MTTMNKKTAVVMTTINIPVVLSSYADNIKKFNRESDVFIVVIPDLKTPREAGEVVKTIAQLGLDIDYVDLHRQEGWLDRFPDLKSFIPYNSDNRRNIGFLMALERGCDVLVSIDDDNYCSPEEDFFGCHSIVGGTETRPCVSSSTGWFNICSMMENTMGGTIYPRGYPYSQRVENAFIDEQMATGYVSVNAGLWSNDPDVDAVTRLNGDVKTTSMNRGSVILARGTKTPVNSQNTAIAAEAIPAAYYVLMGERINGSILDRYGDIWSGYFLGKCVSHMDHRIAVGRPVARHDRNRHNLFQDLRQELWGMILTESLVRILGRIELAGRNYADAYRDLSSKLAEAVAREDDEHLTTEVKLYFEKITKAMEIWVHVCEKLRPSY